MGEPLVSVIVPVYNTEIYINRAVESIQKQSYENIEILLVNDGSNDGTDEVCLEMRKDDKRIKYISQKHSGVSVARNRGLSEAKGEYVFFCDSDDIWRDDLVERVLKEFEEHNCDMVRYGFESKDMDVFTPDEMQEEVLEQREAVVKYFFDNGLNKNMSSCVWGAYKNSIIKRKCLMFDEQLVRGEDCKFVMQYLLECESIKVINEPLYIYFPWFEDRINTTARKIKELYNEYELCMILFREFYNKWNVKLNDSEKRKAYSNFFDRLIGRLVRYAAYTPNGKLSRNIKVIKEVLNDEIIRESQKYYFRRRKQDSRWIPLFVKIKSPYLLWFALRNRRWRYYKMYGKKRYGVSIWKDDDIVEYKIK